MFLLDTPFMNGNSLTMTIVDFIVREQIALILQKMVLKVVADDLKDEERYTRLTEAKVGKEG